MSIKNILTTSISKSLGTTNNIFDVLMEDFQVYFDRGVNNLVDLRKKTSTKERGDLFESFCVLYLLNVKNFTSAWMLKDVPSNIRERVGLGRKDIGIDIVAMKGDDVYCVQVKYKGHGGIGYNPNTKGYKSKGSVGWKELSTFYALCSRTGPWTKHIVMTNVDFVNHKGMRSKKDLSWCKGTFRRTTKDQWQSMMGHSGQVLGSQPNVITIEDSISSEEEIIHILPPPTNTSDTVRSARLRYFESLNNNNTNAN